MLYFCNKIYCKLALFCKIILYIVWFSAILKAYKQNMKGKDKMTQKHNALLVAAKARTEYNPHRAPKAAHIIGGALIVALAGYLVTVVLFSI